MSVNFFEPACQEPSFNHILFGICDDENGTKAYTAVNNQEHWIATVKNDNSKKLTFIAVDKCIIKDNEQIGRGRCDGILFSDEHLFFIELKNVLLFYFADNNFLHYITLADLVDYIKAFVYFSEDSMVTIKMCCILAAVANEKL